MKVAVVCKSDSTGGAAVVSRRLTEALLSAGTDATMVVLEKKSHLPWVEKLSFPLLKPLAFLAERLQIFIANGLSRKDLFKADTAAFGLPLHRISTIKEADTVILNWVNQGMLSLNGVRKLCRQGKKVIWTMHDMWNFTGICHHAMQCRRFIAECGNCPLLGNAQGNHETDLSHTTWQKKKRLYGSGDITFVAVSSWLAEEATKSSLLKDATLLTIPNPINIEGGEFSITRSKEEGSKYRILFAAAMLDNWIKGLPTLKTALKIFTDKYPEKAREAELVLAGGIKNPDLLTGFPLPTTYAGMITDDKALAEIFSRGDVIVNCSAFENLPGTLIEGQAAGCIPVAFDRGGQRDIITHGKTGYLARWTEEESERAAGIAAGIAWAIDQLKTNSDEIRAEMKENVRTKFSYKAVATKYIEIFNKIF